MKILLSGEGGQGVQTIAKIITDAAYNHGYEISYIPHYGVEMRMGISFAYLQLSKTPIGYPKFFKADFAVVMTLRELEIPSSFIDAKTKIINAINLSDELIKHGLPYKSYNMMILGIILKELNTTDFRLDFNKIKEQIKLKLLHKTGLKENLQALEVGFEISPELYSRPLSQIKKRNLQPIKDKDGKKESICFPNLCKGCGLCIEKCPVQAISWSENELNFISRPMPKIDLKKCITCHACEKICPDCAIKIL